MKRGVALTVLLCLIPVSYSVYTWAAYTTTAVLSEFPVPVYAEVVEYSSGQTTFEWKRASHENGVPPSYELRIQLAGWEKVESEGSWTAYEKDEQKVEIVTDANYLFVSLAGEDQDD